MVGCFGLFACLLGILLLFSSLWGAAAISIVAGVGAILLRLKAVSEAEKAAAARDQRRRDELERRRVSLTAQYGQEVCEQILAGELWIGQTEDQLREALGDPSDVDEKVLKTKRREVWKYDQVGANRFNTRVTVENGVVTGWERK
jgi:hypothetical protein